MNPGMVASPPAWGTGWGYPVAPPVYNPLQGIQAKDPEILAALGVLAQTRNLPQDEAYLESQGITVLFRSGQEALELIRQRQTSVEFGDTGDPSAHAIWLKEQNKMIINQRYRGDMSRPVQYAIAEAIYHEAGHATRMGDNQSSIQEELNCLALNTLAYRSHVAMDPWYPQATANGPLKALFENGVALYAKLFFDPDPMKRALVSRVIEKYGSLPPESPDHRIPTIPYSKTIAERVLYELHRRKTAS